MKNYRITLKDPNVFLLETEDEQPQDLHYARNYLWEFIHKFNSDIYGLSDEYISSTNKPSYYPNFRDLVLEAMKRISNEPKYTKWDRTFDGNFFIFAPITGGNQKYVLRLTKYSQEEFYLSLVLPADDFDITGRRIVFNYDLNAKNLYVKGDRGTITNKEEARGILEKFCRELPHDYFLSDRIREELTTPFPSSLGEKV